MDFSEDKYEAFSNKLVDILNYGSLNLALGLGYRLGLFKAMAELYSQQTAEAVADRAGLDRRYVREWLGIMVTGRVVELSSGPEGEALYFLPPEHAAPLIGAHGRGNLGVYTQEMPLLTVLASEAVTQGFMNGQGVPYENYPRFQAFMTELSIAKHEELLVKVFLPSVENGRLKERLNQGIEVLDLGCGEGTATILMAEAFPQSRFTGLDLSEEALNQGRKLAESKGLANIVFLVGDAARLDQNPDLAGAYDYVTAFDSIHDQTAPDKSLLGVHHVLAPGGLFSMVDIAAESGHQGNLDHPMGPFLYAVSLMHCMPVGLCDNGLGLGMMWGKQKAVAMLEEAGFAEVEVVEMDFDPFNYHFLCRKH